MKILELSKLEKSFSDNKVLQGVDLDANQGDVISIAAVHGFDAEILEFNASENSKITSKKIRDLKFPKQAIIGGILRNGVAQIVNGDDQIQANDKVVVLSEYAVIKEVEKFF